MALLKKTSIKQGLEVENSIRVNGNDVSLVGHTHSIDAFPDVDAQIKEKLKNIAVDNASRLNGVPADQYALKTDITGSGQELYIAVNKTVEFSKNSTLKFRLNFNNMITDLQVNPLDTVKLSFNIGGSSAEVLLKSNLNDTSSYFKLSEEVIRHSFIPAFTFNGNIYELSIHNFTPYATNITESITLESISFFISNHTTSNINVVKTKLNNLECGSVLTVSSTSISNNALSGQTLLRVLTDRGDSPLSVSLGNTTFTDSIEKLRYTVHTNFNMYKVATGISPQSTDKYSVLIPTSSSNCSFVIIGNPANGQCSIYAIYNNQKIECLNEIGLTAPQIVKYTSSYNNTNITTMTFLDSILTGGTPYTMITIDKFTDIYSIGFMNKLYLNIENFVKNPIAGLQSTVLSYSKNDPAFAPYAQKLKQFFKDIVGYKDPLNLTGTINGVNFNGSNNITVNAPKLSTPVNINGVPFDGSKNITITAQASGGNADTLGGLNSTGYVKVSEVANAANKIPRFDAQGHLVYPDGHSEWIE